MAKRRNLLNEDELKIATKSSYITSDDAALKLFFEDCQLRNLRPHTFKYYRENLQSKGKPLVLMSESDLKIMILNMQQRDA